jgi:hypothetical protein
VAQPVDVAQLAFAVEDFLRPFAGYAEGFGEGAEEFDNLCDVVVVFAVLCAGLWVEEVVTCYQLEGLDALAGVGVAVDEKAYHGGHTPYVCTSTPFAAQDDFGRAVLSRLDVVCKMMPDPAGVAKIGNLDRDLLKGDVGCLFGRLGLGCARLVEADVGDLFGEEVAGKVSISTRDWSGRILTQSFRAASGRRRRWRRA